jgi:hypothetical protein
MHEICIDYLHWLVYHTDASMKKNSWLHWQGSGGRGKHQENDD